MNNRKLDLISKEIVKRSFVDPEFKERLVNKPIEVFLEYGLSVSKNTNIHIVENDNENIYLILPPEPKKEDGTNLSDEELEALLNGNQDDQNIFEWNAADCNWSAD